MENKTDAVRREILKGILDQYAGKGREIIVRKVKEKGVYKNFVDDLEVWDLVKKFAAFHNIPITEPQPEQPKEQEPNIEEATQEIEVDEDDHFLKLLKDEHNRLSKRILALNRVIEVYEKS